MLLIASTAEDTFSKYVCAVSPNFTDETVFFIQSHSISIALASVVISSFLCRHLTVSPRPIISIAFTSLYSFVSDILIIFISIETAGKSIPSKNCSLHFFFNAFSKSLWLSHTISFSSGSPCISCFSLTSSNTISFVYTVAYLLMFSESTNIFPFIVRPLYATGTILVTTSDISTVYVIPSIFLPYRISAP